MWTQSKGRRQKAEGRSRENLESGIRDKSLGCRALRLEGRNVDVETTDCSAGHGWRDRKAERNADREGQFKYLTVRHLITDCTGGGCGNGEVRNRVLSVGQPKKKECRCCARPLRSIPAANGDWERLEMMKERSRCETSVGRANRTTPDLLKQN
jgi:hypothetical protein